MLMVREYVQNIPEGPQRSSKVPCKAQSDAPMVYEQVEYEMPYSSDQTKFKKNE